MVLHEGADRVWLTNAALCQTQFGKLLIDPGLLFVSKPIAHRRDKTCTVLLQYLGWEHAVTAFRKMYLSAGLTSPRTFTAGCVPGHDQRGEMDLVCVIDQN